MLSKSLYYSCWSNYFTSPFPSESNQFIRQMNTIASEVLKDYATQRLLHDKETFVFYEDIIPTIHAACRELGALLRVFASLQNERHTLCVGSKLKSSIGKKRCRLERESELWLHMKRRFEKSRNALDIRHDRVYTSKVGLPNYINTSKILYDFRRRKKLYTN